MQVTDEIRWFFPGAAPAAVLDWFRDGAPIGASPKRTDIYLPLPHQLGLSVKLREGRLEFKTQAGPARAVAYPHNTAGEAAPWKKEGYRTHLFADIERRLADPAALHVVKERHLRKFAIHEAGAIEISGGEAPRQGCLFEVTQLWLDEAPSWTVALEAFGAPAPLAHSLEAVAVQVLRTPCPVSLTVTDSASYPQWLPAQRRDQRS
jgi:hypothetical protein